MEGQNCDGLSSAIGGEGLAGLYEALGGLMSGGSNLTNNEHGMELNSQPKVAKYAGDVVLVETGGVTQREIQKTEASEVKIDERDGHQGGLQMTAKNRSENIPENDEEQDSDQVSKWKHFLEEATSSLGKGKSLLGVTEMMATQDEECQISHEGHLEVSNYADLAAEVNRSFSTMMVSCDNRKATEMEFGSCADDSKIMQALEVADEGLDCQMDTDEKTVLDEEAVKKIELAGKVAQKKPIQEM
jgi:hypothetical protein